MSSPQYFDFLGTVWDLLPSEERERFGEVWQGTEQIVASAYQKYIEGNLNTTVKNLLPFSTERWLPYTFNDDNFVDEPATFTSSQDLSLGINLTTRYLLKLSVNDNPPIEVNVRGVLINKTTVPEIVAKLNAAFGFRFARGIFDDTVVQLVSNISGISSKITIHETSIPSANACEFILGVQDIELPYSVPEFPWIFLSPYPNLAELPGLQDAIRDESAEVSLAQGTDFIVQSKTYIAFKEEPPEKMWARRSLFDEENPWNNFGFLMDIYQPNSQRYVDVIQGLWFAFWTGPKPSNVKTSLYLLFGLPTAKEAGVVTAVTPTTITTTGDDGTVRVFDIPTGLVSLVSVGDRVSRFDALVSGIDVYDKINRPGFIESEIGRDGIQRFLTENASLGIGDTDETKALKMLEEYTFLPQISVDAFITPDINLANVKTFLDAIKPTNKTYLFQVIVGTFRDEVNIDDRYSYLHSIDVTPNLDANETTYLEEVDLLSYETVDNPGLALDSEVILFQENVEIEVYSFNVLIDSFTA